MSEVAADEGRGEPPELACGVRDAEPEAGRSRRARRAIAEIATCGAEGAIGTEGRPLSEVAEARRRTAPCGRAGRRGLRLERLRAAFMRHDRGGGRGALALHAERAAGRSEEHTSELQSLMRISYAVFCLKKKNNT